MAEGKSFFDRQETPAENTTTETPTNEPEVVTEPVVDEQVKTEPAKTEPVVTEQPIKVSALEEINKKFQTEFKSVDDLQGYFDKAKKADEYAPKLTEYETKVKQYEERIADLNSSLNPLSHFTSQESYIAEQLRKQHPDKSPMVLQEIVTKDASQISDLDVLIKNQMLETPDLIGGENGAKEYILDKYGIDPDLPKAEWSVTLQNKIKIEAKQIRKTWDELKSTVKLPTVLSQDEINAEKTRLTEERKTQLSPLKETFSKFDKFTEQIDEGKVFDFNVPDEYKEMLPEMFEEYFVKAGVEPTKENLERFEHLKRGLLLDSHFKQIYKTIEGDVVAREKAARDILLGNEAPTNTNSGNEINDQSDVKKYNDEHGLGKMLGK